MHLSPIALCVVFNAGKRKTEKINEHKQNTKNILACKNEDKEKTGKQVNRANLTNKAMNHERAP